MQSILDNWENIKQTIQIEYRLTTVSYKTWIEPLQIYEITDDTIIILFPANQNHILDYIARKYTTFFRVTISEMFGQPYEIQFILSDEAEKQKLAKQQNNMISTENTLQEEANLNPKYKYDTFVVGNSNRFAHSASLAVAESPGEIYNPLYLYGGPGLGKTHLMHSIGHFILEEDPEKKILYVTSEDFTNEVIESIRSGNAAAMAKLREKYRTVDVLMVDDIQFIIGKESTQQEFFHTFNNLHTAGKQIILSSDKPPKDMETLDGRFRSRFEWGLIADIQTPDYETRMAILQKKVSKSGRSVDEEILKYISTNFQYNIRELEGALNKVFAYSKLHQAEITLSLAEEALKDIITPCKPQEITPDLIIRIVADHFLLSRDNLFSSSRRAELILPRHIVMYLCRELTGISYSNIGSFLGGKDHSTVMHGIRRIRNEIKNNPDLKKHIDILLQKLGAPSP